MALLLGAAAIAAADTVYQQPQDFLSETFGTAPAPAFLWLDHSVQAQLTEVLGHPYPMARLRYWRAGGKTAWILDEIGKEYPITAGFLVEGDHIAQARVLVYRESRGSEVHLPSFLKQFIGGTLQGDGLSSRIDGITGATLSVDAMRRMACAALLLNRLAQ